MVCLAIAPFSVVCFAVVPFSSWPPRPTGGTRPVFDGRFAFFLGLRFLQLLFFAFSWLHSQAVLEGWEWVLRSRIFNSWSSSQDR